MNAFILLFTAILVASPVEPSARWSGMIADESLQSVAPTDGFLSDADSLAKFWKAWQPNEEVPLVDFRKEMILVGVVAGPNTVLMRPSLDDQGDLRFIVAGTKKGGPGFGYLLLKVSREGVKAVNGKPLTAGPKPMLVTVKVLFGTDDDSEMANVEPWIITALAEAGSPIALPQTGWIALSSDEQRIYTSPSGGVLIDGKVTEQDGKYDVAIDGCDGFSLDQSLTLASGERRVVNITDSEPPTNIFVAVAVDLNTDEPISVNLVGTLQNGVVAIGGETTGTAITGNGFTWELDLGENAELSEAAEKLDGKSVKIKGKLKRQTGVEIEERWIVAVDELQTAEESEKR